MNWSAWFMKLLPNLIASVTPELRKSLMEFAKQFRVDCKKTENPWDDFLADVICWALGVDG